MASPKEQSAFKHSYMRVFSMPGAAPVEVEPHVWDTFSEAEKKAFIKAGK